MLRFQQQERRFCFFSDNQTFLEIYNQNSFINSRDSFASNKTSNTICENCPNPASQSYQFGQKLRGILRIAPEWVLQILCKTPDKFFYKIDQLLLPQEIGAIFSGNISKTFSDINQPIENILDVTDSKLYRQIRIIESY